MSNLSNPSLIFRIPRDTVAQSFRFMQQQGAARHEGVALWPGRITGNTCLIGDTLIPQQITRERFYRIPTDETFRIIQYVAEQGLVIPIQIHSHPHEAFHSLADDEHAFVQHENAISIVVPDFADFPLSDFLSKARFYRLRSGNEWDEIEKSDIGVSFRFLDL
jgi:hypothetical protein